MGKALEYWLRKDYNYSVYGVPCWRMACVAVEGGGDTALAEEIAREHPLSASTGEATSSESNQITGIS